MQPRIFAERASAIKRAQVASGTKAVRTRAIQPRPDQPVNGQIPPRPDGPTSPTQRLPDDLLHDIFYDIAATCTCATQDGDLVSGSVLLLPVSHVCRYWRALTLAYPRLWSLLHITTNTRVAMLREFLARSQGVLLNVKLRGPKSVWEPSEDIVRIARMLAEHADRIEAFHIGQFFKEDMGKVLAFYADKPAHNLHSLMAFSGSYMEIPALFAGDMPTLRRLHLARISMPWLPYRDMVEMEIPSQLTPATEDILWTLRHSPSLTLFSMVMHGDPSAPVMSEPASKSLVHLPRLQRLHLGTMRDTDDVLQILPHLEFPATTRVNLCLRQRMKTNVDLGDLCPPLRAVKAQVRQGFLQFICVEDLYSIIFRSPDNVFSVEWQWGRWQWGSDNEADVSSTTNTLDCVTLPNLTSLAIHAIRYFLSTPQWVDVLQRFSSIHKLEIDFRSSQLGSAWAKVPSFFAALGKDGTDGRLVCPSLTHLAIMRASFVEGHAKEAWDALVVALSGRLAKGAPQLVKLEITTRDPTSALSDTRLRNLEQLVEGVYIQTVRAR
ncbi:uncharacterized protein C8Q71DRAFT_744785 [Rhodofomes roseus]|uniref:F-box domain-containing protein n=1 Tax=Rhodofomes roseus TaxID=34475 RepID=A0ABQ8KNL7_9APHY|nr:uncharacterized protein C8Q71DRAFT_744785 [Rhodofomes roseus]KAH9839911.1 hypothetical protein C8Q71DRAFT_744785 [Rhodofomes roseus]